MSQKPNENFDSKIAVDPFYSASNLAHLRRGIDALDFRISLLLYEGVFYQKC